MKGNVLLHDQERLLAGRLSEALAETNRVFDQRDAPWLHQFRMQLNAFASHETSQLLLRGIVSRTEWLAWVRIFMLLTQSQSGRASLESLCRYGELDVRQIRRQMVEYTGLRWMELRGNGVDAFLRLMSERFGYSRSRFVARVRATRLPSGNP